MNRNGLDGRPSQAALNEWHVDASAVPLDYQHGESLVRNPVTRPAEGEFGQMARDRATNSFAEWAKRAHVLANR
jgi:hypothetical protein